MRGGGGGPIATNQSNMFSPDERYPNVTMGRVREARRQDDEHIHVAWKHQESRVAMLGWFRLRLLLLSDCIFVSMVVCLCMR